MVGRVGDSKEVLLLIVELQRMIENEKVCSQTWRLFRMLKK